MSDQHVMVRRVNAAQKTLDTFKGKAFRFGHVDCVRMTAFHLRLMGHRVKLPPKGSYGTLKSASNVLASAGYANLAEAMDGLGFERIAPAAVLVGDVIEAPANNDLGALGVMLTNGRSVGFHEDVKGAVVVQVKEHLAAWRVPVL